MIDSHCHLQTEQFDVDREAVIAEAEAAGVEGFIVPSIDRASFDATLKLSSIHKNIWCGLGIHPHSASEWNDEIREFIQTEAAINNKVVAVGEIGLDYYYDFAPRATQQRAFIEQIELAKELNRPIIIHTRDSIEETLAIVSEHYNNIPRSYEFGQFHCFTGTPQQALKVVDLGFAVSFTGNITFKNSTLAPTVQATPLEAMLIETDSPYLAPAPFRGKRNVPSLVRRVAEKIAELTKTDVDEVMRITSEHTKRIFRLTALPVVIALILCMTMRPSVAQPGSKPPDSVMTQQRREAEELVRRQKELLNKENEKRREDSVRAAYEQQQELMREAQEQARKDSIRTAERLADEEHDRLRMMTPVPWKAIGIGAGAGVGNISEVNQVFRPSPSPTAVFASSFSLGTAITRGIEFKLSYNSFTAGDDLTQDRIFRGENGNILPITQISPPRFPYYVPTHETMANKYLAFDFHFDINPHSPVKFYLGLGYDHVTIENTQVYHFQDTLNQRGPDLTVQKSFSRGGIKAIFGAQYDVEVGDSFVLTPFVEISASFLFNGDAQAPEFVFRAPSDPITFTHLNVGAQLYYGWFKVSRK